MFYKSRKLNIIRRRLMTIINIIICSVFDLIKLIFWPITAPIKGLRRAMFLAGSRKRKRRAMKKYNAHKRWNLYNSPNLNNSGRRKENSTTSYLSLDSLKEDVKSLHNQINNPLSGIKNIQDEHSRFIQKNAKNRLQCLEDNMDTVLDKIKALEDNIVQLKLKHIGITDVKALEERVNKLNQNRINAWTINNDQIQELTKRVSIVMQQKSNLQFFLPDEQSEAEEDWDKRAREAYEDHMSEPQRRHDD